MRRLSLGTIALALTLGGLRSALGAAPAAPSYHGVERTIDDIRKRWDQPDAPADPNATGWNTYFDALTADLHSYSSAETDGERLLALNRLYKMSAGLKGVSWPRADPLRAELREWLRPRVRLAWAERRLIESLRGLPPATDAVQENRKHWIDFVGDELGVALRKYDSAATVAQRSEALKLVQAALKSLQASNQRTCWVPSAELETALNDLYNQPNVDLTADLNGLRSDIDQNLVTTGPVQRKQYTSQVTAGPKIGFGLLTSDEGIAFYNRQKYTSVTPIWDFNNQIASDPQGQRVTKLYSFRATSTDYAELTMVAVLRPTGLSLTPSYTHNSDVAIAASPTAGNNLARIVAGFVGYDQQRIEKQVYDGAIVKLRKNIVTEAQGAGEEKSAEAAAEQNAKLAKYLIGGNRLAFNDNVMIDRLRMRSRPDYAQVSGNVTWRGGEESFGADAPQPPALSELGSGITADLHTGSILTGLARGYLQSESGRKIENMLIVTNKVAPDAPPGAAVTTTRNADYAAFLKAIDEAKKENDPKVSAFRVRRPGTAPEFGADAKGNLVALLHDFQMEVPASISQPPPGDKPEAGAPPPPPRARLGPPAKVYRITAPRAEVVVSIKIIPAERDQPVQVAGRIEGFDPGPGAKVFAINDDEEKPRALSSFAGNAILQFLRIRLRRTPINVPLRNLPLEGVAIVSAAPLDPSGWIRIHLIRTKTPDDRIESPASRQAKAKAKLESEAVAK